MKKSLTTIASTILLAACAQQPANQSDRASHENGPESMGNMSNMAMPAEGRLAKGRGTVTAIDPAAGKITLDHGPLPDAGWPAMAMAFDAKPEVLKGLAVGEKVEFDVVVTGEAGEVTAIRKQ